MNILVTGATGFIGSHLAERLISGGHRVRCLVRKTANTRWLEGANVELTYGGLSDKDSLGVAVQGMDYIYHSAGLTAARSPEEFFRGNYEGTKNLLEAAVGAGTVKRFVHLSSQAAVGPSRSATPIDETAPAHPITAYGESKWAAEEEVQKFASRFPITIVRPPAVYGPRDTGIYTFFQTVKAGILPLIGFQEKLVSLVHVRDLVNGIVLAGEAEVAAGQTYFIASEKYYSWREVGDAAKRVMQKRAVTVHVPHSIVYTVAWISEFFGRFQAKPPIFNYEKGRDITQRYWICDIAKATRELGYRQTVDIETGFRETVDWYKRMKWL